MVRCSGQFAINYLPYLLHQGVGVYRTSGNHFLSSRDYSELVKQWVHHMVHMYRTSGKFPSSSECTTWCITTGQVDINFHPHLLHKT
jgi:hypothetical protein